MQETISYKPSIGKKKLNQAADKLHFSTSAQFLDFAVNLTLISSRDNKSKKLIAELVDVIYKALPLRFTKPTTQEDKEIRHRFTEMKKGKSVLMHPIK